MNRNFIRANAAMLLLLTAPMAAPDFPSIRTQKKRDWEQRVRPKTKPKKRKPKRSR